MGFDKPDAEASKQWAKDFIKKFPNNYKTKYIKGLLRTIKELEIQAFSKGEKRK